MIADILEQRVLQDTESFRQTARGQQMSHSAVADIDRRYAPVVSTFGQIKRDLFTAVYQHYALENLEAMEAHKSVRSGKGKMTAGDRRNYLTASAIAFDKSLLASGQPTQIVAGIHEVRVHLPELLERLRLVQARVGKQAVVSGQADGSG